MEVSSFLLGLIMVFVAFLALRWFAERFEIGNLENKAVFITGCDSGFGRALAIHCAERGMPVMAGCMLKNSIDELHIISKHCRTPIDAFILDVTKDESIAEAKNYVESKTAKYGGLHGVVNNAGVLGNTFFDDFLTIEDYKRTADVNLWGAIRIVQAFKPLVKRTRTELRLFGVSVHVLEPGFFTTHLTSRKNVESQLDTMYSSCPEEVKLEYGKEFFYKMRKKTFWLLGLMSSRQINHVTEAYYHALTAVYPRARYHVGWDSILVFTPLSIFPTELQDLITRILLLVMKIPSPALVSQKVKSF